MKQDTYSQILMCDKYDLVQIARLYWDGVTSQTKVAQVADNECYATITDSNQVVLEIIGLFQARTIIGSLFNIGYSKKADCIVISKDGSKDVSPSVLTLRKDT